MTVRYFQGQLIKKHCGFHLALSQITYSRESQLLCYEDTQAALCRGLCGKKQTHANSYEEAVQ